MPQWLDCRSPASYFDSTDLASAEPEDDVLKRLKY